MLKEESCRKCGKELTGAIESAFVTEGEFVHIVPRETSDCNWRRCKGCKNILCKKCDDAERLYCCDEGRIVSRERAAAALANTKPEVRHEVSNRG